MTDESLIADPPRVEEQRQRLAALLLTMPGWTRNFTSSVDAAGWLIAEAERVGWNLRIEAGTIEAASTPSRLTFSVDHD